jgi:hypothetical protein
MSHLVTTLHKSLSHKGYCLHSCCLVTAFNGGSSLDSGLTSLQAGDHLMSTTYSDRCLQLVLPLATSFWAGLNWLPCQPQYKLILDWLPNSSEVPLYDLGAHSIENTVSNICFMVTCIHLCGNVAQIT